MGGQSHTAGQLDTSGMVLPPAHESLWQAWADTPDHNLRWSDLSPFTQGYIEALFADDATQDALMDEHGRVRHGFSDLAPETLARIIADCDAFPANQRAYGAAVGRAFWNNRQAKMQRGFRPLNVVLSDAGKVVLS